MVVTFLRKMPRISAVLPFAILLLILIVILSNSKVPSVLKHPPRDAEGRDKLAYVSSDDRLMLYDPYDGTEVTLVSDARKITRFAIARDGRVAFSRRNPEENKDTLTIFEPSAPDVALATIGPDDPVDYYPYAWSADGRYLAFSATQDGAVSLNLWDGENIINITPDGVADDYYRFQTEWSVDGHFLAFTNQQNSVISLYVWDGERVIDITPEGIAEGTNVFQPVWSEDGRLAIAPYNYYSGSASMIYLWDGRETVALAQHLPRQIYRMDWNGSGQLLLTSEQGEELLVYLWDGTSFDTDAFSRIAPDLTLTNAVWRDDGLLGLIGARVRGRASIIVWDPESQMIVTQVQSSSSYEYTGFEAGGQVVMSGQLASGIPSIYVDVETIEGDIVLSIHTGGLVGSADGYLAYCGIDEGISTLLTVWDGVESRLVARTSYRPIRWLNDDIRWLNDDQIISCNNG
jgi:hypothetical protein